MGRARNSPSSTCSKKIKIKNNLNDIIIIIMNQYIFKYFEAYISYIGSQPNLLDTVVPKQEKENFR